MNTLRHSLPALPPHMRHLPIDERGYPVPFFIAWVNGKPDHRIADPAKQVRAIRENLCYICGQQLMAYKAFVVGPMCGVNRISSDGPMHRDCAVFAATACPFLTRPRAQRRTANLPEGVEPAAGMPILRNPGVTLVWITKTSKPFTVPRNGNHNQKGVLFRMGDPIELLWFAGGRPATHDEVKASIDSGLPILLAEAQKEGQKSLQLLGKQCAQFASDITKHSLGKLTASVVLGPDEALQPRGVPFLAPVVEQQAVTP